MANYLEDKSTTVKKLKMDIDIDVTNGTTSENSGATTGVNRILTDVLFESLRNVVSESTMKGIEKLGFTHMTEIQAKTIPHLLEGRDLMAAAKTGSGKTLAFLIPALEIIHKLKFTPANGTGILIISPTRELSLQTHGILLELMTHHPYTIGLVMGGTNRNEDVKRLSKGINILVATPGRLLDHMRNTEEFIYNQLKCLIIDEADRILDSGFERDMKAILEFIPKERQTMLFSATQTRRIKDLARLSLKKEPINVGIKVTHDRTEAATVVGLKQSYIVCPPESRFLFLYTLLQDRSRKVMVFFSTCKSVKFHDAVLNHMGVPVDCIHGRLSQNRRTAAFFNFCQAKQAVLLCTDVAARGLDIPEVDLIIQFDPPSDPKEYIHRVGRTARGEDGVGHAILLLQQQEVDYLNLLKRARIDLSEFDFSWDTIVNVQSQLEEAVATNPPLHTLAQAGFKSFIRAYKSHSLRDIYNVNRLNLEHIARSFGLDIIPKIKINGKPKHNNRQKQNSY